MAKYVRNTIALELSKKLKTLNLNFKFGVLQHVIDRHEDDNDLRIIDKSYYTGPYSFEIETEKNVVIIDLGGQNRLLKNGYEFISIRKDRVCKENFPICQSPVILDERGVIENMPWFNETYDENDKEIINSIESEVESILNLIIISLE